MTYILTKVTGHTALGGAFIPGTWKCEGEGKTGYGSTPAAAHANWASQMKKQTDQ